MLDTKIDYEDAIISMLQEADDCRLYRIVCGFIAGFMAHSEKMNLHHYPHSFNVNNEMYPKNSIKENE